MPKPRKLDQTERCAKCGKRDDRREMLRDCYIVGKGPRLDPLWYCAACWDALHKKEAKDG